MIIQNNGEQLNREQLEILQNNVRSSGYNGLRLRSIQYMSMRGWIRGDLNRPPGGEMSRDIITVNDNCIVKQNINNDSIIDVITYDEVGTPFLRKIVINRVCGYETYDGGAKNTRKMKKSIRKLSKYNIFVRENYHKYGNFKLIGQAWQNLKR